MKRKKAILIVLVTGGLLLGLFCALVFTPAGYIVACMFGMEYYSEWHVVRCGLEKEGDLPPSFNLCLVTPPSKYGEVIPLFLTYRLDHPVSMFVDCDVYGNWSAAQYLNLTRLELVLSDGRRENLLPSSPPVKVYNSNYENARDSQYYRAQRLERSVRSHGEHVQVQFSSCLWPPTDNITLISEGTTHLDVERNDQPFRQVSDWKIVRKKGFRKPWIP